MLKSHQIDGLKAIRETGRKSLFFLATQLLNYQDVDMRVQGPFIKPLDQLVVGCDGTDIVRPNGDCLYVPREETLSVALPIDAYRRYMLLAFRGSLKTTLNTIAHSIQLILNFPHIAMLLYHNTEDKAKLILHEIVDQFASKKMREAYPEFAIRSERERRKCLSQQNFAFTTPARQTVPRFLPPKKEPTITALGLGTSSAGQHVSAIKMTDVVEDVNSTTPKMRKKVHSQIQMAINLLEDPYCLVFIEGTTYCPGDAYDEIIQRQHFQTAKIDRSWHFTYLPVYDIETKGKPRLYDMSESSMPWKVATEDKVLSPRVKVLKGEKISMWPTWRGGLRKFTYQSLEERRREDPYIFACQQLLRPTAEGNSPLAVGKCFHSFPKSEVKGLEKALVFMAVDTAETTNELTSNDTAMSIAIVTETLLRVVIDGFCGQIEAEEIVDMMFEFYNKHKPDIIFLETTSFTRGLKPTIRGEEGKRQILLPIEDIPRKPNMAKEGRILGALRSPTFNKRLRFSDGLDEAYIERVRVELSGFPRDARNDILDTLADIVSASLDLTSYSNPKVAAQAQRHEEQKARQEDFDKWANKIMGRPLPEQLIDQHDSTLVMGF